MALEQSSDGLYSQFNLNCTMFTVEHLKFFNRLRNVTAIVCAAITLVAIVTLFDLSESIFEPISTSLLLLGNWHAIDGSCCWT